MKLTKINEEKIKPIPLPTESSLPVIGKHILTDCYSNVFLCAKKKSGKTNVIFKILEQCVGENTTVIAFVSTINKDSNWIHIKNWCKEFDIPFQGYASIKEGKIDNLFELIKWLQAEAKEKEEEQDEDETKVKMPKIDVGIPENCLILTDDKAAKPKKEKKEKKLKKLSPEYIIILDDLSTELKTPSLQALLKANRHFKSKVIVSSQYLNDLAPEARKQIDVWMVFRGFPVKKLEEIYRDANVNVDFQTFCKMYQLATEKKFSFLYIDTNNNDFRRNFDEKFAIQEGEGNDEDDEEQEDLDD